MEQPATVSSTEKPTGEPIGGWLILVGLITVVNPFYRSYLMIKDFDILSAEEPELIGSTWFAAVYSIESMLVAYGLIVLVFFLQKRKLLPVMMQAFLATVLVGHAATQVLDHLYLEHDFDVKSIARSAIQAAIWIPYFQFSKRVRATFVC